MSEKLVFRPESHESIETVKDKRPEKVAESLPESHEKAAESLDAVRASLEDIHKHNERASLPSEVQEADQDPGWWGGELRDIKFVHLMTSVRKRLTPGQKLASRIIHNPAIEAVSEGAGKTVARPAGFLGGGIGAFTISLITYLVARHIGGEYRLSTFLVAFIGGYLFGLIIELLLKLAGRKSR